MRKFQFTSLTMRIWTILTLVIFAIVVTISLSYLLVFGNIAEEKDQEFLHSSHRYMLQNAVNGVVDEANAPFIKQSDVRHFLYNETQQTIRFIAAKETEKETSLALWMSSFINQPSYDQVNFKEKYKNKTFIFEISSVDKNEYVISYIPISHTEHLMKPILIGIIVTVIGLFVSKLIANSIAKPLERLEAYTKTIANKEWNSDELEITSNDEIGRLTSAMNEMKHALKHADEDEKKFLQSISHDLKTPVMVIMSYAQAIIDGMYVDSTENTAKIIKNEAIRLEKKIKQVLYLNTLDYVLDNEEEQEDVYLDKLLTYLISNFQAMNADLSWLLNMKGKPAIILGNPDRIRVSIENILENQLRYAIKTIEVSLQENHSFWMIEIKNDGPLIPERDLNQIFNNLYKGDHGNFGLGLTISKKIINFYHGSIQVENRDNQVCFTICYPKK